VSLLHKGVDRYGFALFDTARKQITGAEVALYTARADGSGVRGPYVARSESLAVKPQFQSQTTASDPSAAKSVYVADVPFKRTRKQAVIAIAKLDGRLLVTNGYSVDVTRGDARRERIERGPIACRIGNCLQLFEHDAAQLCKLADIDDQFR